MIAAGWGFDARAQYQKASSVYVGIYSICFGSQTGAPVTNHMLKKQLIFNFMNHLEFVLGGLAIGDPC